MFYCMGKIFCVEFHRVTLKFRTKYHTHTLKDTILYHVDHLRPPRVMSSSEVLKRPLLFTWVKFGRSPPWQSTTIHDQSALFWACNLYRRVFSTVSIYRKQCILCDAWQFAVISNVITFWTRHRRDVSTKRNQDRIEVLKYIQYIITFNSDPFVWNKFSTDPSVIDQHPPT